MRMDTFVSKDAQGLIHGEHLKSLGLFEGSGIIQKCLRILYTRS